MPFFSIIVVSLNAESFIRSTIQSILNQTFSDYEIIVKDGQSLDRTLELIPNDPKIHIFSQKDSGIYDAMNQAIQKSAGQYLCFMNCGDEFYDENVLENVYQFITNFKTDTMTLFYGNYVTKGLFKQAPSKVTRYAIYRSPLCHQTMFINKGLFERYGMYTTTFKILADYEFTVKCFKDHIPLVNTQVTVCDYLGDGFSVQNGKKAHQEMTIIRKQHFKFWELILYNILFALTMPKIRFFISSSNSPKFIRLIYTSVANRMKR